MRAYEELVDFIAAGTTPNTLVNFQPSDEAKTRVGELIRLSKTDGLSSSEKAELDHFMQLEHLMRLAKVRARKILAGHE